MSYESIDIQVNTFVLECLQYEKFIQCINKILNIYYISDFDAHSSEVDSCFRHPQFQNYFRSLNRSKIFICQDPVQPSIPVEVKLDPNTVEAA